MNEKSNTKLGLNLIKNEFYTSLSFNDILPHNIVLL